MAMLKDFYVTYEVNDPDDGETLFTGGENVAAFDRDDAARQVVEKFGKYGSLSIWDIELILDGDGVRGERGPDDSGIRFDGPSEEN